MAFLNYPLPFPRYLITVGVAAWLLAGVWGEAGAGGRSAPAGKDPPAGIYCLLPPYEGKGDKWARDFATLPCWTNPNVDGVAVRVRWHVLEPRPGYFNWAFLDLAVQLAKQYHKRVSFTVPAGIHSPAWIYQVGAQRFSYVRIKTGKQVVLPPPWDPVFLAQWGTLIRALGQRYDDSPALAYVPIGGPGREIETMFVDAAADIQKLAALGGLPKWLEGSERIIDLYAQAFPHTPFILAIGPPTPDAAGRATLQELVNYGVAKYPGRFGIMSDSLSPRTGTEAKALYTPLKIKTLSPSTTVGFQMVLASYKFRHGTLQDALNRGIAFRAHFVEVYQRDCNDPAQASTLQQARQYLRWP